MGQASANISAQRARLDVILVWSPVQADKSKKTKYNHIELYIVADTAPARSPNGMIDVADCGSPMPKMIVTTRTGRSN